LLKSFLVPRGRGGKKNGPRQRGIIETGRHLLESGGKIGLGEKKEKSWGGRQGREGVVKRTYCPDVRGGQQNRVSQRRLGLKRRGGKGQTQNVAREGSRDFTCARGN